MKTHTLLIFLLASLHALPFKLGKPSLVEEHSIYLVLVEGEAIAFQQKDSSANQHEKSLPNRYMRPTRGVRWHLMISFFKAHWKPTLTENSTASTISLMALPFIPLLLRLAVYKAMYPLGGALADIVVAIDQAAQDGVDVLVLSIGLGERPVDRVTFINIFDITLLFARRAGIFVAQAVGNNGPAETSILSFSPRAMGVAASSTGRTYTTALVTDDGREIHGVGLSDGCFQFKLVSAKDATLLGCNGQNVSGNAEECQDPGHCSPVLSWAALSSAHSHKGFTMAHQPSL